MDPFEKNAEFVYEDNRINRKKNPITREVLTKKHQAILPSSLIKGKSVLDLGCCVGASGNWSLFYEASSYVGVEVQSEYANTAKRLLKQYGDKAVIYNQSIEEFLKSHKQKYDIVLILGVLHVSFDYYYWLKKATGLSEDIIVIENLYPSIQGHIVQYTNDISINLAGDSNESLLGLGVKISSEALDLMMTGLGFLKLKNIFINSINGSKDVYNDIDPEEARYIVSYQRGTKPQFSISEDLKGQKLGKKEPWIQKDEAWKFDKKVAANFDDIAIANIPNYQEVIEKCVQLALKNFEKNDKILDIGSATGFTLRKLFNAGFTNIIGVESSEEMINASWKTPEINLIQSDMFPEKYGPFSLILANWVLHFICDRQEYMKKIFDGLIDKGIFVFTEKVTSSDVSGSLYSDFKRSKGVSETEIELKRKALNGILETRTFDWYFDQCQKIGFRNVEIIDANFSFITFMAFK